MRIRLILFAAFAFVAIVPIVFFVLWPSSKALDREIEEVSDRHLLLARNMGLALERYDRDVHSMFLHAAKMAIAGSREVDPDQAAANFNIRHICIVRRGDPLVVYSAMAAHAPCPNEIPAARFKMFETLAQPGRLNYSQVLAAPGGEPVIYIVGIIGEFLAVGAIRTSYFVELAQAVSFGEKGHAAIVDHTGRILAHPAPDWQQQMRDLSSVAPVQRILDGETGIAQFFSPAMKADMIVGFTTVPGTGWGVMVPQPMSELEAKATEAKYFALGVILIGLVGAAIVGWVISGVFNRPIQRVADAAREMASGNLDARAGELPWPKPKELSDLATAFNGMADSIEQAIQNEENANRAKSDFLAIMSHELRTPLNAIIGFSDMLKDERLGPVGNAKYRGYADDIHTSGRHLLDIINDILDLSKIGFGTDKLQEENIEISQIASATMTLVSGLAQEGNIELELDMSDDVAILHADERKVKQVLLNLLSNAIKFTPSGGKVTLKAWTCAASGYVLQVIDTGMGIASEDIPMALAPFQQIDSGLSRIHEGTGLGLPLTKALVEMHGGHLDMQSEVGVGTTVTVRFPAERIVGSPRDTLAAGAGSTI